MTIGARRAAAAMLLAAVALGGCGDDRGGASPSTTAATAPETVPTTTAVPGPTDPPISTDISTVISAVAAPAEFPVTVMGGNGEVTLAERPERIVVLSPSLTESVFAVGAGAQVVAVDSASNYPPGAPLTDLSAFRPNIEAIGAFAPDLVLVSRDRDDLVATLASVGIPALVLPPPASLGEVFAQIDLIGVATGNAEAASELTATLRDEVEAQLARVPDLAVAPTYFYELNPDYHTNTSETFVGSILSSLGLANVADGVDPSAGAYPQLNAEYVLESDPDWVFVAHTDGSVPTLDELAARPGWANLTAVTAGRVTLLDVDVASRWGPRIVELVTAFADALVGAGGG